LLHYVDTSVLVAAFEVSHPRHGVCLPWLQQAQEEKIDGCLSIHTLAELYSVLTRLPVRPLISPAIARMVRLNLPGGGIFDALIAQAALKAEVDILLTLNPSHFTRLGQDLAQRVQVPS
jgi:hypothetical protein